MNEMPNLEACRTCANLYVANDAVDFLSLFEPTEGLQFELEYILFELNAWQVKLSPDDGLPQRICANCFAKFCEIIKFRQECLNAQEKLLESYMQEACKANAQMHLVQNDVVSLPTEAYQMPAQIGTEIVVDGTDNDMHEIEVHAQQAIEELNGFSVYEHGIIMEDNSAADVQTANADGNDNDNIYYTEEEEADEKNTLRTNESEIDLEEMLQGSIIPTTKDIEKRARHQTTIEYTDSEQVTVYESANGADADDIDYMPDTRVGGNPLACQYCYCPATGNLDHLIFPNPEELSQHFFDVHDPNLPYTCPHCTFTYKSAHLRDNHVRQQHLHKAAVEECVYCHKRIRGPIDLHPYHCPFVSNWECEICDEKFENTPLHRFRAHQRTHEPSKPLSCNVCDRVFVRRANLEAHERSHAMNSSSLLQCNECKATFSGDYELRRHKYQVHNGELPVKCDFCQKGFVSKAFLTRHINNLHPGKMDDRNSDVVSCKNCGARFSSLHKLRYHVQRPRDENGRCLDTPEVLRERRRQQRQGLYPCAYCAKRFQLKVQLERHLSSHDARLRPYQCDRCHIRCRTSFELKQHISIAHMNIRPYECNKCDKRFGTRRELNEHEKFHAEPNIACPEIDCDYVCKNDKALADHINYKHRIMQCEYCTATFTRSRLITHLRAVHGEIIAAEAAEDARLARIARNNNNKNKQNNNVRVELINSESSHSLNLQEQASNHYKPLVVVSDEQYDQLYIGSSLIDPDHEIIVT